jgi:hypothetical protein
MHIVKVRRRNADLAAAMGQMRTWLDNQAIEPVLFEIAFLPGRENRFRLEFGIRAQMGLKKNRVGMPTPNFPYG